MPFDNSSNRVRKYYSKMTSTPEGREKMRERSRVYKARTRRKAMITRLTKSKVKLKSALLPVQQEEVEAIEIQFLEMLHQKGGIISKEKKDEQQMRDLKVLKHVINAMKGYAKSNDDLDKKMNEGISVEINNKNESKNGNGHDNRGNSKTKGINDEEKILILKVMQDAAMLVSDDDTHGRTTPGEGINDDNDSFKDDIANVFEAKEDLSLWMIETLEDENNAWPSATTSTDSCEKASTHELHDGDELGLWIAEALTDGDDTSLPPVVTSAAQDSCEKASTHVLHDEVELGLWIAEVLVDGDDTSLPPETAAQDTCEKASTHVLQNQEDFSNFNWITEGLKDDNDPLPPEAVVSTRSESCEKARAYDVWKDNEGLLNWDELL